MLQDLPSEVDTCSDDTEIICFMKPWGEWTWSQKSGFRITV